MKWNDREHSLYGTPVVIPGGIKLTSVSYVLYMYQIYSPYIPVTSRIQLLTQIYILLFTKHNTEREGCMWFIATLSCFLWGCSCTTLLKWEERCLCFLLGLSMLWRRSKGQQQNDSKHGRVWEFNFIWTSDAPLLQMCARAFHFVAPHCILDSAVRDWFFKVTKSAFLSSWGIDYRVIRSYMLSLQRTGYIHICQTELSL